MKIAILYICTGKYNLFFNDFFESCEKYFLKGEAEKTYFVWTDDMLISNADNVRIIEKQCEGFPFDSLFRFRMFEQAKRELITFDYIYFFNSNAEFRKPVTASEILPTAEDGWLVGAEWPGKRKPNNHPMFYPYERRKKSLAYIGPCESPYTYYMGGLNGGRAAEYLDMIIELNKNIQNDYKRGIIAVVHDESHINAYFRSHKCRVIRKEYVWPEEWINDFEPKMIFRDKVKVDPYFNKGRSRSVTAQLKKLYLTLFKALCWYLKF